MNKQIFIHVGPPKTGTSAIQKWLNEHSAELELEGLYYPNHKTDKNGVSSGNLLEIFSRNQANDLYLDNNKIKLLLESFNTSKKYHMLLLSSEFFFMRMSEIRELIPDAIFIAYLRNPIEKRESQYNQGIKRASFTHIYPNKVQKRIQDIHILSSYIKKYSADKLTIRIYGDSFFHGGNIINDILSYLGIKSLNIERSNINKSYQLEALELKRWLNKFSLGELSKKIDTCLQAYSSGTSNYTLIKPEILKKQKKFDYNQLVNFFDLIKIENSEEFLKYIDNYGNKEYYQQNFSQEKLFGVVSFLQKSLGPKKLILLKKLEIQIKEEEKVNCELFHIFNRISLIEKFIYRVYLRRTT